MQLYCNYNVVCSATSPRPRGLTLLELVVVLAIIVVLSGMVVPLISGLGHQTNASTNATVVGDVNQAVRTFHARFEEKYPNGWDSLLGPDGELFSKLHPSLTTTPLLQPTALTETQAKSLAEFGGIWNVYVHDSALPNAALTVATTLTTGAKAAILNSTATSFANEAFNVYHLDNINPTAEYVVLGMGPNTTIRNAVMTDVPLISSADPNRYYARVLCVFMVPGSGTAAESFAAKYVGCFLPDGTSLRNNLDKYNNSGVAN